MKKGLHTLIRLQKRQVDMLRREIAQVEARREQLLTAKREREEALVREKQLASQDVTLARSFPPFADRTRLRIAALQNEIENTDRQIEGLREVLRSQFAELKKYEIARDKRLQEEKKERERIEQNILDEVGIGMFQRKE